jgi:KUP system potassium uptake protein
MAKVSDTFTTVALRFGFMEEPDVPGALLQACREAGVTLDMAETSFYLSRRALRPGARSAMPQWQDRLFIWLTRRATDASAYFKIPTDRAVEVGTQVVI